MQVKQKAINKNAIETQIQESKDELIKKLKKKIEEKNNKIKDLKHETKNLHTKLDEAYLLRKTQKDSTIREKLNISGRLAEGIAHELKNSLNIISISVQYLHNKFTPGEEKREFTEAIMDKVDKLNSLATDLIYLSQLYTPHIKKIDIHKILNRTIRLLNFKCTFQKVKVVRKYEANLPPIEMDEELMEQVFLNLMDNAFAAMPEGGKLIIITSAPSENNFIEIKVTGTGCGIPRKDIPTIFEPFFNQRKNGSGLGLAIAYRIIEEHQGTIVVESELNKGTTFIIRLPISHKK